MQVQERYRDTHGRTREEGRKREDVDALRKWRDEQPTATATVNLGQSAWD
jgi:hypothetical protein